MCFDMDGERECDYPPHIKKIGSWLSKYEHRTVSCEGKYGVAVHKSRLTRKWRSGPTVAAVVRSPSILSITKYGIQKS